MMQLRMAAPISALLVTLTIPTVAQTPDDTPRQAFMRDMQTPAQVSTANATPPERRLSEEETGDLFMARKQYREASETYKRLSQENPKNAVFINKPGIALHQQAALSEALKY